MRRMMRRLLHLLHSWFKLQRCWECKKRIHDEDWVVNWGSCSDCLDRHLEEYERHS